MFYLRTPVTAIILSTFLFSACENSVFRPEPPAQTSLATVPAVRLNYRYEADVPAPPMDTTGGPAAVRNAAVQVDFDGRRPAEILDRTLTSPDEKSVLAIYHRLSDPEHEYRLDMYLPDGTLLRQITPDAMAVSWPEAIEWSPDSSAVAFAAKTRTVRPADTSEPGGLAPAAAAIPESEVMGTDMPESASPEPSLTPPPAAAPAANVLTFGSEQIYICGPDGTALRALTTNDGLKYFYFTWSPDSSMLAALAITSREYEAFETRPAQPTPTPKQSTTQPPPPLTVRPSAGRLRIVEKNGRERRLDDARTGVKPVWSPDSTKVAAAFSLSTQPADPKLVAIFDAQIRVYDAAAANPTQAAIPLRLPLLLSAHAYDRGQTGQPTAGQDQLTTVPDVRDLRSLGPISELAWNSAEILYFKTTLTQQKIAEAEAPLGFSRWHRLIFSSQPAPTAKQ